MDTLAFLPLRSLGELLFSSSALWDRDLGQEEAEGRTEGVKEEEMGE